MAILRHALPDGSVHHDLLLASVPAVPDESRSVATWRCEQDPLGLAPGMATGIERIAPHRGLYLRLHERRDLGTDRGVVTPEHAGWHRCGGGLLWIARHGEAPLAFHLDDRSLRRAELPAQAKAS